MTSVSAKKLLLTAGVLLILSGTAEAMNPETGLGARLTQEKLLRHGIQMGWLEGEPSGQGIVPPKLHQAAATGDLKEVKLLVQKKHVDVNHQHADGATALYEAAFNGHIGVVQWLVQEAGARTNLGDETGCRPLHAAASGGHLPIVRWLITEGDIDIDQPDHKGCTALYWSATSASHRHAETAWWLLEHGADPAALDPIASLADFRKVLDTDRLLRQRNQYVRAVKEATRKALVSQDNQWQPLLALLYGYLGWEIVESNEAKNEHDDVTEKASRCSCVIL